MIREFSRIDANHPHPASPKLQDRQFRGGERGNMKRKVETEIVYRYVGDGQGVPGLPHEITRGEAEKQGVLPLLDAAIAAGVYVNGSSGDADETESTTDGAETRKTDGDGSETHLEQAKGA